MIIVMVTGFDMLLILECSSLLFVFYSKIKLFILVWYGFMQINKFYLSKQGCLSFLLGDFHFKFA